MLDVETFAAHLSQCYQRCWLVAAAVTGDRAEADDIVQEAAMIAMRKLADFTSGTNFAAWISQIVRLTALNHSKKTARRRVVLTDPGVIDRHEPSAAAPSSNGLTPITADGRLVENQSIFDDQVLAALAGISEIARACLLLRIVGQLSYRDIAQTLGIPESTAMSHVHRAKQSIREQLMRQGDVRIQPSKAQGQR